MNTRREFPAKAPPGTGLVKPDAPASHEVKCGRGGYALAPLKARNPALSILGPWLVLPFAIAAWGAVGILGALVLHLAGV